jgi:hypothetical protein
MTPPPRYEVRHDEHSAHPREADSRRGDDPTDDPTDDPDAPLEIVVVLEVDHILFIVIQVVKVFVVVVVIEIVVKVIIVVEIVVVVEVEVVVNIIVELVSFEGDREGDILFGVEKGKTGHGVTGND